MKDLRFAKLLVTVNAAVPGVMLAWDAWHHRLGANPVNYCILTTGMLTLVFLGLTLLVTPLRKITGLQWLFHFRRTLGLFAFFYCLAHFAIYFSLDRGFSVSRTLRDILKHVYIIFGLAGLLLMLPLALTSFNRVIKRMGPKRWQLLHRLVYLAAVAGVVHFYLEVKSDERLPIAFAVAIGLLLLFRLVAAARKRFGPAPAGAWAGTLKVAAIERQTPDVQTFRLAPARGRRFPFSHKPGQHLSLALPITGKTVRRSYTIASSPNCRGYCELTIKRDSAGTASRHLHDTLRVGDTLEVMAPHGTFVFDGLAPQVSAVALVGGGVGITPLMSMVRYLTETRWKGDIYLLYSNKSRQDIVFHDELEMLQAAHPNLHVTHTLTRAPENGWAGRSGRVTAAVIAQTVPALATTPFYICGPGPMIDAVKESLRTLGVPEAHINSESFGGAGAAASTETFTVTFAKSRRSAPVSPGTSLLELAESLGVSVDSECRSGICGRCACPLLAGTVTMAVQEALTAADRAAGKILLCQAQATSDVRLNA